MSLASSINRSLFDPDTYLARNPDLVIAGVDPLDHWLRHGRDEERRGTRKPWLAPSFDMDTYVAIYPEAIPETENLGFCSVVEHWFGARRGEIADGTRSIPATFDEAAYLHRRPDVKAALEKGMFVAGFDHWLQWGSAEEKAEALRANRHIDWTRLSTPDPGWTRYADNLTGEKAAFWDDNGYLILEGVISPERCEAANRRIDRLWRERRTCGLPISIDIYLERAEGRRMPFRDAPGDARAQPYKINDLVMWDDAIRGIALDVGVADVLRWVLRADPVAIGSLNFERGSTQRFHTDTLYMPGKTPGGMTAAWFALENVTPEAGPLLYYAGSNKIPMYHFSTGRQVQFSPEMPDYDQYMADEVKRRKLIPQRFLPKQGDVLIWHELLYHGGSAIEDMAQTRKSLVVHYHRDAEMPDDKLVAHGKGYYWDRPPLA